MAKAWSSFRIICKLELISWVYLIPSFSPDHLSIFEIYPQSEKPQLTQIAHLDWFSFEEDSPNLLPDTLIYHAFHEHRIVFRIVNYRTNYSTSFPADIDAKKIGPIEVIFILFKTWKLASNYLLRRYTLRRQLLSSSVKKDYLSGPSLLYRRNRQMLPTTLSISIPQVYRHSSKFHSRMMLYTTPLFLDGRQSLPGILDLGIPFISTLYIRVQDVPFRDSKSSSNPTSVMPLSTSRICPKHSWKI